MQKHFMLHSIDFVNFVTSSEDMLYSNSGLQSYIFKCRSSQLLVEFQCLLKQTFTKTFEIITNVLLCNLISKF